MGALRVELDDAQLDALAARVAERIAEQMREQGEGADRWLDAREASHFLGLSISTVHKLTASRMIPFEQEGPGCKCWFRRSDLDAWRRSNGS